MPIPFDYKSHIKKMFAFYDNAEHEFSQDLYIPRKNVHQVRRQIGLLRIPGVFHIHYSVGAARLCIMKTHARCSIGKIKVSLNPPQRTIAIRFRGPTA